MSKLHPFYGMLLSAATVAFIAGYAHAEPARTNGAAVNNAGIAKPIPEIIHPESIAADDSFLTGGIGEEDREALEAQQANYNFHLLNTAPAGEYKGDTHIVINDRHGEEIINAMAGPIFYTNLPAGNYMLQAFDGHRLQEKRIRIAKGKTTNTQLIW